MGTIEHQWEQGPSLVESVWRYRLHVLLAAVVLGVSGFLLSSLRTPQYTATTTLRFRDPGSQLFDSGGFAPDPENHVTQQASRALSRGVLQRAARSVPGESGLSLQQRVAAEPDIQLNRMVIAASAATPADAARMANAVADAYESTMAEENTADIEQAAAVVQEQITQLDRKIARLDNRLQRNPNDPVAESRLRTIEGSQLALETRAIELAANATVLGSGVQSREPAIAPLAPSSPQPLRDAVLLAGLGCAIASAVAYGRGSKHRRTESRADPATVLDVPLLGEIPTLSQLSADAGSLLPGTEASESYQVVLSSIEFSLAQSNASSVLITSATAGDGKTSTALHLAVASARESRRVTLVDGDLRARGLTSRLSAEQHDGLLQLVHGAELSGCTRTFRLSDAAQLSFVPTGVPSDSASTAANLMRTPKLRTAIEKMTAESELVIIDSPPVLSAADATILASYVDAVVLVVDRHAELEQLMKVQERLAFVPTRVIGYVYNRASLDRHTRYAYGSAPAPRWSRWWSFSWANGHEAKTEPPPAAVPSNGQQQP